MIRAERAHRCARLAQGSSERQLTTHGSSDACRRSSAQAKTVGAFTSFAFTVNNVTGPGMLNFPQTFRKAGWVPTVSALVVVCMGATMCALMLSDTIARVPKNRGFTRRVEYSTVFAHFMGKRVALFTQVRVGPVTPCLATPRLVATARCA